MNSALARFKAMMDAQSKHWRPHWSSGNQIALLHSGTQFFPALEAAIRVARNAVHLETYIFSDDAEALRIALALADASVRGVRVCVVVDGFGTPQLNAQIEGLLTAAGVQVRTFRSEIFSLRRRFAWVKRFSRQRLRRLHRKLAVVDGTVAFVGGINILADLHDPNHGMLEAPRFDFAVQIHGPLVREVEHTAQRLWYMLNWRSLRWAQAWQHMMEGLPDHPARSAKDFPLSQSSESAHTSHIAQPVQRAALVLRDNLRNRHAIESAYLQAIAAARQQIIIANAYFFPGRRLRHALLDAAARGVQVTLLLQGRVEYRLQHYASQALYNEMLKAGMSIVEYHASFLHAKVAVVDDHWATVGSSNIDPFSLLLAREANVVVRDRAFAHALQHALLQAIEQAGHRVTPALHAQRGWWARGMNWFAYGLLRVAVALLGQRGRY